MEAADWVAQYHQHWEDRLDRLVDYLQTLQSTPGNNATASAAPGATPATLAPTTQRQPKEKKP